MNTPASLDDSLTSAFDAVLRSIDHVVEDTITEGARLAQKIVSRERAVFEERYATAEAEKAELSSQIRSLELQLVDAETLFTAKCIEAEELNKKNEAQAVRIQQLEHLQHGIEATEAGDSNPAARTSLLLSIPCPN